MGDTILYTCRECKTATTDGHVPPERDCPVCGHGEWYRKGQIE